MAAIIVGAFFVKIVDKKPEIYWNGDIASLGKQQENIGVAIQEIDTLFAGLTQIKIRFSLRKNKNYSKEGLYSLFYLNGIRWSQFILNLKGQEDLLGKLLILRDLVVVWLKMQNKI